ncbi:hypothetical protein GF361_00250 [Candidatus Woesearchaeota archaeon]|nr:hypothetical protein [Candidatus Woesearchaeota archaeon]
MHDKDLKEIHLEKYVRFVISGNRYITNNNLTNVSKYIAEDITSKDTGLIISDGFVRTHDVDLIKSRLESEIGKYDIGWVSTLYGNI